MSLLPFFQWCEETAIGEAIRGSLWLFPVIEAGHLLALSLIGGAILVVDLRLLGLGLRGQEPARIARNVQPWLIGSLTAMLVTGVPLFLSESIKCYYSPPFWWKMSFLALASLFTFTVRHKVARADESKVGPLWNKLVALVSLTLWTGVGISGRWIAFY